MKHTSISKFRKDTKGYLDKVIEDQDILLITRNDGRAIVVMTLDEYSSKVETDYLNSSPANRAHLEKSIASLRGPLAS